MIHRAEIGGVMLAGGRASRMNFRDKALQPLHGQALLAHGIRRAGPQVEQLVLSVNHRIERYEPFDLPLICDHDPDYGGPLLGIYSAMHWFRHTKEHSRIKYLACFAADVPEFPQNLVNDLAEVLNGTTAGASYVVHAGQIQPLFSLWRLSLIDTVRTAIDLGVHGPKPLFQSIDAVAMHCDYDEPGAYFNINDSDDLQEASRLIPDSTDASIERNQSS